MGKTLTVSVPDEALLRRLGPQVSEVELLLWDMSGPAPRADIDIVVPPYMGPAEQLRMLDGTRTRLVQYQTIGYDNVQAHLPTGAVLANAAGVHEASTAELTLALILASQRNIPAYVRAQQHGKWLHQHTASLADSTVLLVGYGGVGKAVESRLLPFETTVVRMASRARDDERGHIHGLDELPALLPEADIVVLGVPLSAETRHLADAAFLARMKDGALLVNMARGPVVDTDALVAELQSGRVRAALDVTDPEPLPQDHPLWSLPNVLISPHVGGASAAMVPRVVSLIAGQAARLQRGETPVNIVHGRWA